MKIGTIEVHLSISSAEQLDRLVAALKEVESRGDVAPEIVAQEPEKVVVPAPKLKAGKVKANGPEPSPVTVADTSPEPVASEPLSRDDVRARLGLYASKHGMAAAVAAVKAQGVDHLDALAVEKLPDLVALLDIPPSDKAS